MQYILLLLTVLLSGESAGAQLLPTPDLAMRSRYGITTGVNWNLHSADFQQLPGIPNCCPIFDKGSGAGLNVGILYELPLSHVLMLDFRSSFAVQGATLKAIEEKKLGGDVLYDGKIEHDITTGLSTIGIEPLLGIRAVGRFHLFAGGRFGFVVGQSFEQSEKLLEPQSGTFSDTHQRTRNQVAGTLPDISSFQAALLFGAGHEAPLNKSHTLLLAPEMFFQLALTPVIKSLSWHAHALRFGLTLKYIPVPTEPDEVASFVPVRSAPVEPKQELPVSKPVEHAPLLAAAYTATAFDNAGQEIPFTHVRYEEFVSSETFPLLNYVFFEEGSDQLPARYSALHREEASSFTVEHVRKPDVLPLYYQVLNIVGRRMTNNPQATITLVGCNADQGIEKGNTELSRHRAEIVRSYLQTVWGIDEHRMKIEVRNLPLNASKTMDTDVESAVAENRRVEILSDTWTILEPVMVRDTLRTILPSLVRFNPRIQAESGIQSWSLAIASPQAELAKFTGRDSIPGAIEWRPAMVHGIDVSDQLQCQFIAEDRKGQHSAAPLQNIQVERITLEKKRSERIADREIDRYRLILFDFDRAGLSGANKRIMEDIRQRIREDATITITGFTDRLGDAEYNRKLSEDRARAVSKVLGIGTPAISGVGEKELYDNTLPEGRFYSRTVHILVETPVR